MIKLPVLEWVKRWLQSGDSKEIRNVKLVDAEIDAGDIKSGTIDAARLPPGLMGFSVVEVDADYEANSNEIVLVDASDGDVVVMLPEPEANLRVAIKKVDPTENLVVVDAGSSTIDGSRTVVIRTQYEAYDFYCNGSEWYIL